MNKKELKEVIKTELSAMFEEVKKKEAEIDKKLEELRKKLVKEGALVRFNSIGEETLGGNRRPVRHLDIKTVSELINIPINELTLYFIRTYKNQNERKLIEKHLGEIHFFLEN